MRELSIICRKCNRRIKQVSDAPFTQKMKMFPLWPFVPSSLICFRCGETAEVVIEEITK